MSISSIGQYTYTQTYAQAGIAKVAGTSAVDECEDSSKSVFDRLKETFPDINFVTGSDPFARKDVRNNGRNTVYLDAEALRKLETYPRYAARVFSDIESSKEIFAKGFSSGNAYKRSIMVGGALNLSFYGKDESSKVVAMCITHTDDSKKGTGNTMFKQWENEMKAYNKWVTDHHNNSLKKWFDHFGVPESERVFFNFDEAWSRLQAAQKGVIS